MAFRFSHHPAEQIMNAAIERVDPVRMILDCVKVEGETLRIATEQQSLEVDLARFKRILVLGAGKAGAAMARGLELVLEDRITDGLVSVKYGHTGTGEACTGTGRGETNDTGEAHTGKGRIAAIRLIEAGHPVPDDESQRAAREIAALAETADEDTLCITLISGGGSALLTLPAEGVTLEDIQATTHLLLGAGTPIGEINCVRKHLSGISGGRFCSIASPATVVALILSDVVGDELESIASGLAAPDPTTFEDALRICERYGIRADLPHRVRARLEAGSRGEVEETPKPGDPVFERVQPVLIGTNALALEAARTRARSLGYNTLVLTSRLTGEAREIARLFTAIAGEIVDRQMPLARPACIMAGGETTVTIRGKGKGGRNQEMALAVLVEMAGRPSLYRGVTFLSFGTDGNDGPTDAAGGWASLELFHRDGEGGARPTNSAATTEILSSLNASLADNDSYHALESLGALVKTGPTNTNVCDIQVLLVE